MNNTIYENNEIKIIAKEELAYDHNIVTFEECFKYLEKYAEHYNSLDKGFSKALCKEKIECIANMIENLFECPIFTDYFDDKGTVGVSY